MAKQRLSSMNIEDLIKLRDDIGAALDDKAKGLQLQLRQLGNGDLPQKRGGVKGRKVPPKYRSKKNPKLTWAGRGATPVWMRDEMKAGKLKKDAFLIK
jgi:DNA-binding protein H-NS